MNYCQEDAGGQFALTRRVLLMEYWLSRVSIQKETISRSTVCDPWTCRWFE